MFVEVFVLLTAVVMYLLLKRNSSQHRKMLEKFPGPRSYPIVGNIFEFIKGGDIPAVISRLSQQYGPLFVLKFWSQTVVILRDPADIEELLSHSEATIEKSPFYNNLDPWIGRGLYQCPASRWKSERKLITATFHAKVIESFVPALEKNSRKLAKIFLEKNGSDFNVLELVTEWQFENLIENLFGLNPDELKEGKKYIQALRQFAEVIVDTDFGMFAILDRLFPYTSLGRKHSSFLDYLKKYADNILREKRVARLANKTSEVVAERQQDDDVSKYKPLLDMLLDLQAEGADIDDEYIQHQIGTFVTAGLDTVATAMTFLLYALSQNPDVQESVYEEVQKAVGGSDRGLTYQDILELRYLDRVIKESTRMYGNVFFSRTATQDIHMKAGYTIPKNTIVGILAESMHKGPHYKNPEKFDPDRFNTNEYLPYIAFGAGIRNCVGKRYALGALKTGIATVLRHVRLVPSDLPLNLRYVNVLRSTSGVNLRAEPRRSC